MKPSILDILTGVILLGILCLVGYVGVLIANPFSSLNFLPPSVVESRGTTLATQIILPSQTPTYPSLPDVWTPTPTLEDTKVPVNAEGLRFTSTPIPTNTLVRLPTFTPTRTPVIRASSGSCSVTFQDPADNTVKDTNTSFTVSWALKNTGTIIWRADSVDIVFLNGARMHSGNDVLDMPYDVSPNGLLSLTMNMNTPSTAGAYTTNWALKQGSQTLCGFYLALTVR